MSVIVEMREPLRGELRARLMAEMAFQEHGAYLQNGLCPACGKKECFTSAENPWVVQCGRLSKCGQSWHVKELFPEAFSSWTERFRPVPPPAGTPVDPNAPPASRTPVADAYLTIGRGLDISTMEGWYTEETYHDSHLGATTTTVRFALPNGYWERLIDRPERFGKKKARVQPGTRYQGLWWQPPGLDLAAAEELYITEGIFDALSLRAAGCAACASVGVSNYPGDALAQLAADCTARGIPRPTLVWAYDGDPAGTKYSRAHAKLASAAGWEVAAAVVPAAGARKRDWNDALQRGELTPAHLEDYRYHGALHLAASAAAKGTLIYGHTERREFWFEFARRTYWFKLDQDKYEKALKGLGWELIEGEQIPDEDRAECLKQARSITELANCHPQALYYLANPITDEAWYYWSVHFPHDGAPAKNTFTGGQLASASEFKKRLLHIAPGAMWQGTSGQLDRILRDQISGIKTVQTIDFIGYSREHGCYVWGDLAVKAGKLHRINAEDYFDFGRQSLKTLAQSPALAINDDAQAYQTAWAAMIWQAYGARGVIALAFWLGSIFAEQIRQRHKSLPFLEIVGEAASGKSTLIEFLWKLLGRRDYEGFDPLKSTLAGRSRNMTQVANLPVVLIESDRDSIGDTKTKQFDWDEMKPLYNGRPTRSRGFRNQGNDTYEPPFRAALVIAQNAAVCASDAILQRICHLEFSRTHHTAETKRLAEILERMPMESVSGFLVAAALQETKLLTLFDLEAAAHERYLASLASVKVMRLAKNHSQLAALVECLGDHGLGLLPKTAIEQALLEVERMAGERQQAINSDHPIVQEFWEAYDYLQGVAAGRNAVGLNHAAPDSGLIAINLKHLEAMAAHEQVRLPDSATLKRYLKSAKTRKFIEANRAVRSQIYANGRTTRCWVFAASQGGDDD